jgi:hypothetical protein
MAGDTALAMRCALTDEQVVRLAVAAPDIPAQEPLSKSLHSDAPEQKIWKATSFLIATASGIESVNGYVCDGLGLHTKRRNMWHLTHLRTGHCVFISRGNLERGKSIGDRALECGNWDFDIFDGWKNRDPELKSKVESLFHKESLLLADEGNRRHEKFAREIAAATESFA